MNEALTPGEARCEVEEILGVDRSRRATRRRRWSAVIAGLVTVGAIAVYLAWGMGGAGSAPGYVTEAATRADLTVLVTATGSVEPTNQVDVSSELSGIVREVFVDYNSRVTAGQPLARLDTDRLEAIVASARAKLAAAKAKVKDAEATVIETRLDYERKRRLAERKVASEQDLQLAEAAYQRALASVDSAKAAVEAAEADLKLNETDLAKSSIRSPINGIVLARDVEPGQTVASSLQAPVLFTIAEDLTKMEVQVDVDEADVGKVREGQSATFTVDAYPERQFNAKIRELRFGSEVMQGVVTYKAVLTADNSDLLLRPGMTATAEITVNQIRDALTVPNGALRFSPPTANAGEDTRSFLERLLPGRPRLRGASSNEMATGRARSVWVLQGGEPKQVPVTVGATDGRRTQIVDGAIEPGEAVIVDTATTRK